ncbi:cell division inhibitor SepF [Microlunatus sagamiharensis]|uniref:Cell division protein SepF n=1 Tax=Microlunatus sagamiharensis TaxID=546874 RepID=A0A1H2MPD9_9ACTN|nr:cell division protein SepF [Microlunatus sagamiharensis]SDU94934.1 cell division inhibitor SepF [Microlunatus sagamiharensis]
MAERLKRAAAWLGLVTDDRYAEYEVDDAERTEGISREELIGVQERDRAAASAGAGAGGSVTTLQSKRPTTTTIAPAPVAAVATQTSPAPAPAPTPAPRARTADLSRITTVHPRTYNEARTIGEHFRDGVPVIMNLSQMEDVDAKRLVDFAAGLIFGLHGTIERVTSKVFLLSPQNVTVATEDKERIASGFFNQS